MISQLKKLRIGSGLKAAFKDILICLTCGLIGLVPAYLTVGLKPIPGWLFLIYIAVYSFMVIEAVAANRGERSTVMLLITLFSGLFYYLGLLCQPTIEGVNPAAVISAGFVMCGAFLALLNKDRIKVLTLGSVYRLALITVPSWLLAEYIAYKWFPYQSTSPFLGIAAIALGIVPLLLEHVPFALYGWGNIQPGSPWMRIPPIIGASLMLMYYTGYDLEHYRLSVMLNIFVFLENSVNFSVDYFMAYFGVKAKEINPR